MDSERMLAVADAIEAAPDDQFDMSDYLTGQRYDELQDDDLVTPEIGCGSAGCIAGWTVALYEKKRSIPKGDVHFRARDLLKLGGDQADNLFFLVDWWSKQLGEELYEIGQVTKAQAIEVLRGLADGSRSW